MYHSNKTNHAQQQSNDKKSLWVPNPLSSILKLKKIMQDTQLFLKCLRKAATMEVETLISKINSKQQEEVLP